MQRRLFKVKEKEADIQKAILKLLKLKKCYPIRFNSGAMRVGNRFFRAYILPNGKSEGLPDILFFKAGLPVFIEVKRPGGKLRDSQKEFIETIDNYGIDTIVADNWEMVFDYVNKL